MSSPLAFSPSALRATNSPSARVAPQARQPGLKRADHVAFLLVAASSRGHLEATVEGGAQLRALIGVNARPGANDPQGRAGLGSWLPLCSRYCPAPVKVARVMTVEAAAPERDTTTCGLVRGIVTQKRLK